MPQLTDKISKHLTYQDVVRSEFATRNGLRNDPTPAELENAKYVAATIYDRVKDKFPQAGCYSFFRSDLVNMGVGGAPNSFHRFAAAIDIDSLGDVVNRDIFRYVMDELAYTELIWEYGTLHQPAWVHAGALKGDSRKYILHLYYNTKGEKKRDLLTPAEARKRFLL